MSNNTKKLINRIILVFMCCMLLFSLSGVYGQGTLDPSTVTKPPELTEADVKPALDKVKPIIGYVSGIGIAVSIITLVVLGIKYMVGSIEERAEYKKSMMPYFIGAFLVFGISTFLTIIMQFTNELFTTT